MSQAVRIPTPLLLRVLGACLALMAGDRPEAALAAEKGAVSGRVTFEGAPPRFERLPVYRDNRICGEMIPDEAVQVDSQTKGLTGVVVSLEGVPTMASPAPDQPISLTNLTCRFWPRVSSATVGAMVEIRNQDPILHNTHLRELDRFGPTVLNVAQPVGVGPIQRRLSQTGLVDVRCDAHTFMKAVIQVFDHPYHTVTNATGQFVLPPVPPGTYTIRLWHEVLGSHNQRVTVPETGSVNVTLTMPRGSR